jgi:mono/diheme cytochrome c family protein
LHGVHPNRTRHKALLERCHGACIVISGDDALAIRAYLASLAPIRSPATKNTLIFPFNQRYLMRSWKLLFFSSQRFELDTSRSEGWNRGAYLARALAHCGECHTPRNLSSERKADRNLPVRSSTAESVQHYVRSNCRDRRLERRGPGFLPVDTEARAGAWRKLSTSACVI